MRKGENFIPFPFPLLGISLFKVTSKISAFLSALSVHLRFKSDLLNYIYLIPHLLDFQDSYEL